MRFALIIGLLAFSFHVQLYAQTNRLNFPKRQLPNQQTAVTGIFWKGEGSKARPRFKKDSVFRGKRVGGQIASYAQARAFSKLNLRIRTISSRNYPANQVGRMNLRLRIPLR